MLQKSIYSIFFFLFISAAFAQDDKELIIKKDSVPQKGIVVNQGIDPLSPSRAAFYSAVFPGLGQAYNKKWWKVPVVWAVIGTGVYFYERNDDQFKRAQTAYKASLAGRPHEFDGEEGRTFLSDDALIRAQDVFKKNRDISLFITIGLYALNILEANVDAHLPDKALDTNLTLRPAVFIAPVSNQALAGITFKYDF
ncbi:MAG: DUF5683 domain-containing protein [Flavobacteriaceae bacterium]|nr:DUF5683 domain-containing protein [Flavobacteriaceae bacterium]